MKKLQKTVGRWIQRIAGKSRVSAPVQTVPPAQELDSRALARVSGGDGGSTSTPFKGW
jgi:hypothetical protein